MKTPEELKELWKRVREIYAETRDTNPRETITKIIEEMGFESAREVFAAVAKIKKHDGRIYGDNRKWTNMVPTDPTASEWGQNNALIYAGLDDIHTTHINQLITELRKFEN